MWRLKISLLYSLKLNKKLKDKIGAVSGHPVSLENKNNFYGYVSHLLTDMADKIRKKNFINNKFSCFNILQPEKITLKKYCWYL